MTQITDEPTRGRPVDRPGFPWFQSSWKTILLLIGTFCLSAYAASTLLRDASTRGHGVILKVHGGEREIVVPTAGDFAKATFSVENTIDRPVVIHAAVADCTCVSMDDLPMRIPPNESRTLTFRVTTRADQSGQVLTRTVRLLVEPESAPIHLSAIVRVGGSNSTKDQNLP